MTRWTILILLASLFWQQGSCCCQDSAVPCWIEAIADAFGDLPETHGCCAGRHREAEKGEQTPFSSGDHEHHICIGTHVFFLAVQATPEAEAPGLVTWIGDVIALRQSLEQQLDRRRIRNFDSGLTLSAVPLRAELQVFLI